MRVKDSENQMTRRFHHVALTTGQVTPLVRDKIADHDIAVCAELLDGVLLGALLPIPQGQAFLIDGSHYRDDLKVTLWSGLPLKRVPILTVGVARGPTSGVALWREMHRSAKVPLTTDPTLPPAEPWIADRPEPGAPRNAAPLPWLGNWVVCLGWTWLEYGRSSAA